MLFFVILGMILCGGESLTLAQAYQKKGSYKVEAESRKAEAQKILQQHLQAEGENIKNPCIPNQGVLRQNGSKTEAEQAVQGCQVMPFKQDITETIPSSPPSSNIDHQILVFVSFSMPPASLKALFEALDTNQEVKLVMRGLVEDSMEKTVHTLHELGGVLDIHPELFDQYQITQVPTFVRIEKNGSIVKLSGNITLNHAKEIFNAQLLKDYRDQEKTS